MSTFRAALRGTTWAVLAQVVIGVGQIAYSALTARVFTPQAFGEFTAAFSLHSVIVLCAGTGLSSFVLREPHLDRAQLRAISAAIFSLAILGAAIFWFVSPVWLVWLNSPGGAQYVPLLTWATFAFPVGAVQTALLRREGNGFADAAVYVVSFIVANGLAGVCAILFRQPWTLALGMAVNPTVLIALSTVLRRAAYPSEQRRISYDWVAFAFRVTGQNLVFMGLAQVPTWAMGASSSPASLGQFSRGNTLASLAANALSTGMIRGTSPHWRKVENAESRTRGVSEALLLAATVSFTGFAVLAALSRPLTELWLGPGWQLAAEFTAWLSIGFSMLVPMALLANYLEMTGVLYRVRWIQLANALGLGLGVVPFFWQHDFRLLMGGFVLSQLAGLITATYQVSLALEASWRLLLKQLIIPLASAVCIAGAAFGVARMIAFGIDGSTAIGSAVQLLCGGLAAASLILLMRGRHPALSVLVARGVLKDSRWMAKRSTFRSLKLGVRR